MDLSQYRSIDMVNNKFLSMEPWGKVTFEAKNSQN